MNDIQKHLSANLLATTRIAWQCLPSMCPGMAVIEHDDTATMLSSSSSSSSYDVGNDDTQPTTQ